MTLRWTLPLLVGVVLMPASHAAVEVEGVTDPFAFFLAEPLPLDVAHAVNQSGYFEWGIGVTSDDNVQFGRYNGLDDNGVTGIFNLRLQFWDPQPEASDYWGLRIDDLGRSSTEGALWWGRVNDYRIQFDYRQLTQLNDKNSETPFHYAGASYLTLPSGWVAAGTTAGMSALPGALDRYEQKVERERFRIQFRKRFDERWSLDSSAQREAKNGLEAVGAAFYLDASNPHAVILPQPIDSTTDAVNLAAQYGGDNGSLQLGYLYSRYDNQDNLLRWENPYASNYGAEFDYPNGVGGLGQAPDNQAQQLRVTGNYRILPTLLAQLDAAYNQATQDQRFEAYSVNPAAVVVRGLPRDSLDGEVNTTTLNATLISNAIDKLTLQAKYRYQDRDNKTPRDGYLYVRGDSGVQPADQYTIYNRPTSTTKNTVGLEGTYRLPASARLSLGYQFEEISRYNLAVNRTREDTWDATLKIQPLPDLFGRFYLAWSDRAASTYQWESAYYALLDPDLINATPQTQRYNNHPLLSQYLLANRERLLGKINLNWVQSPRWQHNLDLLWSADDYDETDLGLTEENHFNTTLSSSFIPSDSVTLTAYYSFDQYDAEQRGREFNGGIEKNAFVTIPPYPQASDPDRDWQAEPRDVINSLGFNLNWLVRKDVVDLDVDYSFADTNGEQHFQIYGAADLLGVNLPDNRSRLHHLNAVANWHVRRDVTLKLNYQYYRYQETTWANDGVTAATLDKVLGTGATDQNETVNFVGVSMLVYLR